MIDLTIFTALARRLHPDGHLLHVWPLTGGVSAQVTAFEVARTGGETRRYVLRVHGEADRTRNPDIATHEFRLLDHLHAAGVAVPAPHFVDATGALLGLPGLVVDYADGTPDFTPTDPESLIAQAAAQLARIHQLNPAPLAFLPALNCADWLDRPRAQPDDSLHEERIREALRGAHPLAAPNDPVLLHGDYWPGNWLWRDGAMVAVIDWEDAALGDPLADLANARLETLWAFGADAMARFTAVYTAQMPSLDLHPLPYYDLCAALHPIAVMHTWTDDSVKLESMRGRLRDFVERALAEI